MVERKSNVSDKARPALPGGNYTTIAMLVVKYPGQPFIPVEDICRDFFTHLTPEKLLRKISAGEIELPILRIEESQKAAKGVHILDLATYIDKRRAAALKEMEQLARSAPARWK